jgi:hypothetical protein
MSQNVAEFVWERLSEWGHDRAVKMFHPKQIYLQ